MYFRLIVPLMLIGTLAFGGEEGAVDEANFVPAGLEISEHRSVENSNAKALLGPAAGIASMIEAAAAKASSASGLLPDFGFVRGVDLSWDNWFTPSSREDEW